MPTLKTLEERETIELTLPTTKDSSDPAVVVCYTNPIGEDIIAIGAMEKKGDAAKIATSIARVIKSWNYLEADGTPVPVSYETVGRLDLEDLSYILEKTGIMEKYNRLQSKTGILSEEKKSS